MKNKENKLLKLCIKDFATFRSSIRSVLFPYWPNNPAVSDKEIYEAIKRCVDNMIKLPKIETYLSENDKVLVVEIDTTNLPEDEQGQPIIRVYLNDGVIFENPKYQIG